MFQSNARLRQRAEDRYLNAIIQLDQDEWWTPEGRMLDITIQKGEMEQFKWDLYFRDREDKIVRQSDEIDSTLVDAGVMSSTDYEIRKLRRAIKNLGDK